MPDQFICPDRFRINARARRGVGILLLAAVTGCAGRAPQPVAVVQLQDRYADCPAILAEVQANNKKLQNLAGEQGGKVAQNVAAGVVGLFVWPVLFGMDFQGAADKEVDALNSRQQYLAVLAEQRNCGAPAAPPPAAPPVSVTQPVAPAASQPVAQPVTPMSPTTPMQAATPTRPLVPAAPPSSSPPDAPAPQSASGATSATPLFSNPTAVPSGQSHDDYEQALRQYEQAEQLYQSKLRDNAGDKRP